MVFPPLHPIFVNFTAALLPVSLLSDLLARAFNKNALRETGSWTLLFAAVITPFTVLAGWMWLWSMHGSDHPQMRMHQWLGTALSVVFLLLASWRWKFYRKGDLPTVPYLIVATLIVGALTFQGHLGGSMSFGSADESSSAMPRDAHKASESAEHHDHSPGWRDHIDVKD